MGAIVLLVAAVPLGFLYRTSDTPVRDVHEPNPTDLSRSWSCELEVRWDLEVDTFESGGPAHDPSDQILLGRTSEEDRTKFPLHVTVVDAGNERAAGVDCLLTDRGSGAMVSFTADSNGEHCLTLPPGSYWIECERPLMGRALETVALVRESRLVVQLERGRWLEGSVRGPPNLDLTGIVVTLAPDGPDSESPCLGTVGPSGAFRIWVPDAISESSPVHLRAEVRVPFPTIWEAGVVSGNSQSEVTIATSQLGRLYELRTDLVLRGSRIVGRFSGIGGMMCPVLRVVQPVLGEVWTSVISEAGEFATPFLSEGVYLLELGSECDGLVWSESILVCDMADSVVECALGFADQGTRTVRVVTPSGEAVVGARVIIERPAARFGLVEPTSYETDSDGVAVVPYCALASIQASDREGFAGEEHCSAALSMQDLLPASTLILLPRATLELEVLLPGSEASPEHLEVLGVEGAIGKRRDESTWTFEEVPRNGEFEVLVLWRGCEIGRFYFDHSDPREAWHRRIALPALTRVEGSVTAHGSRVSRGAVVCLFGGCTLEFPLDLDGAFQGVIPWAQSVDLRVDWPQGRRWFRSVDPRTRIEIELEPVRRVLRFESSTEIAPAGSRVQIDGGPVMVLGERGEITCEGLSPGRHDYLLCLDQYRAACGQFDLEAHDSETEVLLPLGRVTIDHREELASELRVWSGRRWHDLLSTCRALAFDGNEVLLHARFSSEFGCFARLQPGDEFQPLQSLGRVSAVVFDRELTVVRVRSQSGSRIEIDGQAWWALPGECRQLPVGIWMVEASVGPEVRNFEIRVSPFLETRVRW